jgi:hypothetical protein
MLTRTRILLAAAVVAAAMGTMALTTTMTDPASAQTQDGLVNVMVGDVTILKNVSVAVAANVVAQVCGVTVQQVNVLASNVDQTGVPVTVCRAGRQNSGNNVSITDN